MACLNCLHSWTKEEEIIIGGHYYTQLPNTCCPKRIEVKKVEHNTVIYILNNKEHKINKKDFLLYSYRDRTDLI
jgi:hypothetical protein